MERWVVSDHHFWHDSIITYCKRPFANSLEMNEALVEYHNSYVKPEDHVYFLGDVTMRRRGKGEKDEFKKLIRSMHGHKTLFLGNHDHWPTEVYLDAGFEKIRATWRDQDGIIYSHIPIHPSSIGSARANVHGHIHNNQGSEFEPVVKVYAKQEGIPPLRVVKPYINVSVEVINYHPVTVGWIKEQVKKYGETPTVQT